MSLTPKIAFFGGSFNPPHVGHMLAIAYVRGQLNMSVVVVPTFRHEFNKELTPFNHRMKMSIEAFEWMPGIIVSSIEQELGESKTYNTIQKLMEKYNSSFRLMIGSDVVNELKNWYEADALKELAPPLIIPRAGHSDKAIIPKVSSSEIRLMLESKSNDDMLSSYVNKNVLSYIRKHKLYVSSS